MSHSVCEKLARWLLEDRECFETAQRAVKLSVHAFFSSPPPPPLQTQMGATVMLLARSCTLAKWISDSEMMAGWQWITDGGGFNVCNPCPSITELSFFRRDHHSSLLLFFLFPFFWPSQAVCWNIVFLLQSDERWHFIIGLNKIWVNRCT